MTDERIDVLFEALKNERPSVQSKEVIEWLDHAPNVQFRPTWKTGIKLKILLFGIICFIAAVLVLRSNDADSHRSPSPSNKPNTAKVHVGNGQDNSEPVMHTSARRTVEKRKQTDVLNIPSDTLYSNSTPVPFSDEVRFTEKKTELVKDDHYWTLMTDDQSKESEIRDYLFILDSLQWYGRKARFTMDEPDCYVQIYNDYAVISYRFRNRTYYSAGTIHREETQVVDGKSYNVFAFQADNAMVSSNFGSRVFFGFRELENRTNDIEIIFFSQPWAPTSILVGHNAAPEERRKLRERAKSQERKEND
jgi:hypothetical protein